MGARSGYLRQRYPWVLRWLPPVVVAALGLAALIWGVGRETPMAVLVGMACLPLWTVALSWPLWRAPEEGLPQLMRWRSRQRRICARVAVLILMGAGVGVMLLGFFYEKQDLEAQHAWAQAAIWLAVLSPVPVVLDPLVWWVWTRPFRGAVRSARVVMRLQHPRRFASVSITRRPTPGFDPDQGYCGRPIPVQRTKPPLHRGKLRTCEGSGASVSWDGEAIKLAGARGRSARIPIERVAELVTVTERGDRRYDVDELLVLDATGHRVASLNRRLGPTPRQLADLASAAGVPFADYELGRAVDGNAVMPTLFPRAKGHRRIG